MSDETQQERSRRYHRERYRRIRAQQGHTPPPPHEGDAPNPQVKVQSSPTEQQPQRQQGNDRGSDRGQDERQDQRQDPQQEHQQEQEQELQQEQDVTLMSDEDRLRRAGWDEDNQRVTREELLSALDQNDRLLEVIQKGDPRDTADRLYDAFSELNISDWDFPSDDLRIHRTLVTHLIDILIAK